MFASKIAQGWWVKACTSHASVQANNSVSEPDHITLPPKSSHRG